MDIIKIIVAILISWGIITLLSISNRRSKLRAILSGLRFTVVRPHDDEGVRALTTLPFNSDIRILHLWQAMDFGERTAWHGLMHTLEDEQQRQDKEEAELANYDRSTDQGENAFLQINERMENQRQHLRKHAHERIDFFVNRIRERLDDEARVSRYLNDRAVLSSSQAQRNSERVTEIQISKYMRDKHSYGISDQRKEEQNPSVKS